MDFKKSPFLKIPTIKINIEKGQNTEGSYFLKSNIPLKKSPHRMTHRLAHWAKKTPDNVFLAQKNAAGEWETLTYSEALRKVKAIAFHLLQTDVSPEKPIAILSENSIEHALMAFAALHIGVPFSPIAPAYSLKSTDFDKLKHAIQLLTPAMIFVQNGQQYEAALKVISGVTPNVGEVSNLADVLHTSEPKIIAVEGPLSIFRNSDVGCRESADIRHPKFDIEGPLSIHTVFDTLTTFPKGISEAEAHKIVEAAHKKITPSTIAKILFTSGSTGLPKGVINTHGNITTNWQQITQTFPFMANGGLVLMDWLPWNHVFGGNHNLGLTLFNGGTLYIDNGNPTPKGIKTTVENLRHITPTVYFNVPKGFEELLPYLKSDKALAQHFFSKLKLFFYAGAGMPQHVWDGLEQISYEITGKRLMIASGLGMTEASPSALFNTQFHSFAGLLGVPVPELSVKLVPNGGKLEARFKGPNMTTGYWRNPEATAKAFDEEGYYLTGDALKFLDENDPNKGMIFDGRIAEDFKLDTGTWVSVGVLKAKLIAAGKGLIQDAVITGHDRSFLGAIVFPELNFCKKLSGLTDEDTVEKIVKDPSVLAALQAVLNDFSKQNTGSSTLIKRAVFANFNLSIDKGEITDKGSINQRQILANRKEYVEMIYAKSLINNVLEVKN